LHNLQNHYNQSMQAYLTRTAGMEGELVFYMQWLMTRRDATLSTLSLQMNPTLSAAFLANWGYQQFPWPWQLADKEAITAYIGSEIWPSDSAVPAPTPSPTSEGSGAENTGAPLFSPADLTAAPGDIIDFSVSQPWSEYSGGFLLIVSLPANTELVALPQCSPPSACQTAALQTDILQEQGGTTVVSITGLVIQPIPASFAMTVRVSDQAPPNSSLMVTAEITFQSRSVPENFGGSAVLEIVVTPPGSIAAGVAWSSTRQRSRKCSCAAERSLSSTPIHFRWNSIGFTSAIHPERNLRRARLP